MWINWEGLYILHSGVSRETCLYCKFELIYVSLAFVEVCKRGRFHGTPQRYCYFLVDVTDDIGHISK